LNPSLSYDVLEEGEVQVSDRFDGVDELYHVVAFVENAPASVIVEIAVDADVESTPDCQVRFCNDPAEETIGLMEPVDGVPGLYEFFWDVPEDFDEPADSSVFYARLFEVSGDTEQLDEDSVPVDIETTEDATELTWPSQNGVLGFYKGRGGAWRAVVDGSTNNANIQQIRILYTIDDLSAGPTYKQCASSNFPRRTTTTARAYRLNCALAGKDTPTQITALAAVALEDEDEDTEACEPALGQCVFPADLLTMESADVHVVRGFAQTPAESVISLLPIPTAQAVGGRQLADNQCITMIARVRDQYDRPVQGANIDFHAVGPTDTLGFGADYETPAANNSSREKAPDKGGHNTELGWDCDYTSTDDRGPRNQGDSNVPAGPDIKHIESVEGSGLSGGGATSFGEFRFHLRSQAAGLTNITAWLDDEALNDLTANRDLDNDVQEADEKFDTFTAQWFSQAPRIEFQPTGATSLVGSCVEYVARVRAGAAAVANINVDVHATGPDDQLDFCDPENGSDSRAPDLPASGTNAHTPEEEDEASHGTGAAPHTQHTEGETDESGNFTFGITSPTAGDTTLLGWVDKEPEVDNDVLDAGEPSTVANQTWGSSLADANIRFLNPSAYGSGTNIISDKGDSDSNYHLSARTDAAEGVPVVEFLISSNGSTFTSLGMGTRVGLTDTFDLFWDSNSVADGEYTLRVQIVGTSKVEDRAVTVNNDDDDPDPGPPPTEPTFAAETAELSKPLHGASVTFSKGKTNVTGTASSGADAVEIYYTKTSAGTVRTGSSWTLCGRQQLNSEATAAQSFSTTCTVAGGDQASLITGIAAVAVNCDPVEGCPEVVTTPAGTVTVGAEERESGDAHRVFAFEANPVVSIEPAEAEAEKGECQRFVLRVTDQLGEGIGDHNIDLHLTGPDDDASFCDPGDASDRSAPTGGSHTASSDSGSAEHEDAATSDTQHTEGVTKTNGRFIFGVTSLDEGDSSIIGWADVTENDELDSGEASDTAVMHWISEVGPGGDKCTIRGTQGDDVIEGTGGDDIICGMGGNDIIKGKGGDDLIRAGFGKDTVRGGAGADIVRGRQGADKLFGGPAGDTIQGGRGRDRINGGPGHDGCVGGPGRDRVSRCE
jgi:Ca2+-binding RTX toxin-like protein